MQPPVTTLATLERPPGQRVTLTASSGEHAIVPEGSQLVLIEGASGSDKSALIQAIREVFVEQDHIFCICLPVEVFLPWLSRGHIESVQDRIGRRGHTKSVFSIIGLTVTLYSEDCNWTL
jgi:hypothetical protein